MQTEGSRQGNACAAHLYPLAEKGAGLRALLAVLVCVCLALPGWLEAAQEVRVGGYDFPPYLLRPESHEPQGLTVEVLALLNRLQDDYRFVLVPTAAGRRYRDLASGRFDLLLFESSRWGWQDTPHIALPLPLEDTEVYVALRVPGRDQDYFADLSDKRMALYRGLHYGFAGLTADPDILRGRFAAQMTYSHDSNLRMLLLQRADVAVVTRSYLRLYAQRNPASMERLLVSTRLDQRYQLQALLRPGGLPGEARARALLSRLVAEPAFVQLLHRYHLQLESNTAAEP